MAGRIIVLLLLILVLAVGGVVWFDYLNIIDAKTVLAPVYRLIGREGRTQDKTPDEEILSLDAERLAMRLEALDLRNLELDQMEQDIQNRRGEIEQMAQELEDRQKAVEEQENSLRARVTDAEIINRNVEQSARYLTSMPPDAAVGIISAMDDQLIINVFRKTEEIAQQEGNASLVSVWMSRLDPARAAELQRKMVARPSDLN
ncbi:flagellar protein FlbB [Spirochaetia bacterium]|nr:flagellar protein FlbB [Spirochaetia bacterium]